MSRRLVSPRLVRAPAATLAILVAVLLAACDSGSGTRVDPLDGPGRGGSTSGPVIPRSGTPEPGIAKGRVTDEQGDPISGARLALTGYTGGSNGHDDGLVTNAEGEYRVEVPDGSYEIFGTGPITFEGATYVMNLRPADGDCSPGRGADGIVKDMVLALSGPHLCFDSFDPDQPDSFAGATINLLHLSPRTLPADASATFTLEPVGALADGSTGRVLTFTRTAAGLESSFGTLGTTADLPDIPLGRYRMSGVAVLSDGSQQTLRFRPDDWGTPTETLEVGFEPYMSHPYGIRQRKVEFVDEGWSGG